MMQCVGFQVRFTCGSEQTNILSSIKEPSTCSYVILFTTPLLCKHPVFQKKVSDFMPSPYRSPPRTNPLFEFRL